MKTEIDRILEHYGTKGMKWGVRKQRSPKTPEQIAKSKARRKTAIKIGAGAVGAAAATAGVVYAVRASKNRRSIQKGKEAAEAMLKRQQQARADKVKASLAGRDWIDKFKAEQNNLIKLANADLKAGYERGQTPFPLREYLKEWD